MTDHPDSLVQLHPPAAAFALPSLSTKMMRALLELALPVFVVAIAVIDPAVLDAKEGDPRLVHRTYVANEVVRLDGKMNVQVTIMFAEDERIENVAIGDSASWQVTPNRRANLLFLKPLTPSATTNMTVITDRRSYFFDLVASPNAKVTYLLDFKYSEIMGDYRSSIPFVADETAQAIQTPSAKDPYALINPESLNFNWDAKGAKDLLPARIYDDGVDTFLIWQVGQPLPAILIKDYRGDEGPVNFAVRGETLVLQGVPREIVLRFGDDTASLYNRAQTRQSSIPEM